MIYVGGGNTANMLAIWRVHGIDRALREAWSRGAVLGGMSAGANCWFEGCVTDSFGPELRELARRPRDPLGQLLPALRRRAEQRRPTYTRLVGEGILPPGYAADDDAAFHFHGTGAASRSSASETARAATASQPRARSRSSHALL